MAVSNLDLVPQSTPLTMFCMYPPCGGGYGFSAVVATFEAHLPSLLNHFFLLSGRIRRDPRSGFPEVDCGNQGAELVVADAGVGVALACLDYSSETRSLERILLPFSEDVALSVQLVSFACGGFTVAWRTNHVLVEGRALGFLVSAWSELVGSGTGTLAPEARPNHDRSVFRAREPPSYSAALAESFTPLELDATHRPPDGDDTCFVKRLYFVAACDIARLRDEASGEGYRASRVETASAYIWKALAGLSGAGHDGGRCPMGWPVDGRQRITAPGPGLLRNYIGNVSTLVVREASAQEVLRMPLREVAAMAREAVMAPAYDEHFQELVDWLEEHKGSGRRYAEGASQGVGAPAVIVSAPASSPLQINTDFGFGHAALLLPMGAARVSSGYVRLNARPGGDGSWVVAVFLWRSLAAALDSDENHLFQPLTAHHLGLWTAPQSL